METITKTGRHHAAVKRFEDILDGIDDNVKLMWECEGDLFTLYGYLVRGEIVINQVMHNGYGSWQFTALRGNQWDQVSTALSTHFHKA